jgi:hypothetical protein
MEQRGEEKNRCLQVLERREAVQIMEWHKTQSEDRI